LSVSRKRRTKDDTMSDWCLTMAHIERNIVAIDLG
jgi:hypothetical protein